MNLTATTHQRRDGDILVRPLLAADAPLLHEVVRGSIDSLSYWLPWCHAGYSLADAEAWVAHSVMAWQNGTEFPFGIFDGRGELLGGAGLNHVNRAHGLANIGYWIGEAHRGKGTATRAVALVASIGFQALGFTRLEIVVLPDNQASRKVAEKLGATCEVLARNRLVFKGKPAPAIVYSLLPGELAVEDAIAPKPLRDPA